MCGDETVKVRKMMFVISSILDDVMTCAKFGVDRMNTLDATKGQKQGFPIEIRPCPYNIATRYRPGM